MKIKYKYFLTEKFLFIFYNRFNFSFLYESLCIGMLVRILKNVKKLLTGFTNNYRVFNLLNDNVTKNLKKLFKYTVKVF